MGRTGILFALEQERIHADITTTAKGLGAGYQPIPAVMASEKVCDAIIAGSGKLWNGAHLREPYRCHRRRAGGNARD